MSAAMVLVQERGDWKGQKVRRILAAHVLQSFHRAKEYDYKREK